MPDPPPLANLVWPRLTLAKRPHIRVDHRGMLSQHPITRRQFIALDLSNPGIGNSPSDSEQFEIKGAQDLHDPASGIHENAWRTPNGMEWGSSELGEYAQGNRFVPYYVDWNDPNHAEPLEFITGGLTFGKDDISHAILFDFSPSTGGSEAVFSIATPVLGKYQYLVAQAGAGGLMQFAENGGGGGRSLNFATAASSELPGSGERLLMVIRSSRDKIDITINGKLAGITTTPTPGTPTPATPLDAVMLFALDFGAPLGAGSSSFHALHSWKRWISDDEISAITHDPYLPFRPYRAEILDQTRRRVPCPGFPVTQRDRRAVDMTDGKSGSPVIVAAAKRINQFEVEINFANLTPHDRQQLEEAWDNGRSLVNPFRFQIPGEAAPEEVVFRDGNWRRDHRNAVSTDATVALLIVSPPDWTP